jgi:hypothetical protein
MNGLRRHAGVSQEIFLCYAFLVRHAATALALLPLLFVLVNGSPVGQKNATQASGHNGHAADHKNEPGPPVAVKELEKDNRQKGDSVAEKGHDITRKNGFDYAPWSFRLNLALLGVTLIIAVAGLIQAIAAKQNAKAAMLNATALIESQRPQIAAQANGNPMQTLADRQAPRVEISLFNRGSTPAYDLIYESWIEILPSPFKDFTPSADHFKSPDCIVLYPGHVPMLVNIPLRGGLAEQQLGDLMRGLLFACIRVRVEYRDALGPPGRYADFGFAVHVKGLRPLPKYNNAGPKAG